MNLKSTIDWINYEYRSQGEDLGQSGHGVVKNKLYQQKGTTTGNKLCNF